MRIRLRVHWHWHVCSVCVCVVLPACLPRSVVYQFCSLPSSLSTLGYVSGRKTTRESVTNAVFFPHIRVVHCVKLFSLSISLSLSSLSKFLAAFSLFYFLPRSSIAVHSGLDASPSPPIVAIQGLMSRYSQRAPHSNVANI